MKASPGRCLRFPYRLSLTSYSSSLLGSSWIFTSIYLSLFRSVSIHCKRPKNPVKRFRRSTKLLNVRRHVLQQQNNLASAFYISPEYVLSYLFCLPICKYWGVLLPLITLRNTPQTRHYATLDERSARRRGLYLYKTQYPQQTDIHALTGSRTRNPSKRSAADLRLRSCDHGFRLSTEYVKQYVGRSSSKVS